MAVKKIGTLNKHENPATNENKFDIEDYMNANWDKIKEVVDNNADELSETQTNKVDKVDGKGLSTEDYTTAEKQKLAGLNNYDDTETKEDIQDIKSEQTTQNTKLQELEDNQIHITTERASNLNVQDASGQNAKINVFGISKQETRSGKNILNATMSNNVINGITYTKNSDGSVTANGTATNTSYITVNGASPLELKANTQYRLTGCPKNGSNSTYMLVTNILGANTHYDTGNGITFSLEEDSDVNVNIRITAGTTVSNLIFYPMLRLANNGDDSFEEYGVSPSPKYPSEIENTTGNVKIMDYNKNFLGIEDSNHTSAGLNWQITDNEVKITGTTTAVYSTSNEIECFIPAGSYKFLAVNGASNLTYRIWLYSSKNELLKYSMSGEQFTLTENAVKYRLVFDNLTVGNTYNTTFNPMILLQTETDEEFEAHEEEVKTFPLAQNQKMLEGSETKEDGIHHKRKQVELDGTENIQIFEFGTAHITTTIFNFMSLITKKNNALKLCSHFKVLPNTTTTLNTDDNWIMNDSAGNVFICIKNNLASTVEEIKTYLAQQKQAGTPVIVEYELAEEDIEPYTEEQQTQRDQLQNAKTYKTVTNVFTDNAEVEMNYIADTKTYVDNEINSIKEQLNTINELLSTTTTSAMLLDNMQSDLESEVL